MKEIRICSLYLTIFFGLVTTSSCQTKVENTVIKVSKKDRLFKQWVKDTTAIIKKHPDIISNGLVKSQIVVAEDSLLFSDFKTYEFDSKSIIKNDEISNVISLLREYKELPRDNYKLSFVVGKNYYPSMFDDFKYDFTYELKNISLKTFHTNTEYSCIRGRLSGKKVFKVKNLDKSTIYNLYDFVWEGDKLIKRLLK